MKTYTILAFIILSLGIFNSVSAQKSVRDSSITIPSISLHYAYEFVGGDLAERFGNNHKVGGEFNLKLKNNFILAINMSYLFGSDVKNEANYFHAIRNDHGYIIDGNGNYASVFLYERGFNTYVNFGYQFNILAPNPNSGVFATAGFGFMQHYVRIENPDNVARQVVGDYAKLYDRLSNGFSTQQTIGYRFIGNRNLTNFYFGFEFTQAWTQSRRSYNADDMKRNTNKHLDLLFGLKLGWIIPIYGRAPQKFYY